MQVFLERVVERLFSMPKRVLGAIVIVDPAGIVYFPHYFDMFNGLIEDPCGQELGYDYGDLNVHPL
jgi:acyl-CoA thioesterase FadM